MKGWLYQSKNHQLSNKCSNYHQSYPGKTLLSEHSGGNSIDPETVGLFLQLCKTLRGTKTDITKGAKGVFLEDVFGLLVGGDK